ncbi:hypothetical protein Dsin_000802 [Dipteronia sinensis]|uniref:Uncharacterized protein n=1 Tax=Dipteronia sinensis TaxID=43782 RepID=A0AAE0EHU8_9ROSI|nr:hypothetical protein Dsin_000802 [Dipteronia sinensis]
MAALRVFSELWESGLYEHDKDHEESSNLDKKCHSLRSVIRLEARFRVSEIPNLLVGPLKFPLAPTIIDDGDFDKSTSRPFIFILISKDIRFPFSSATTDFFVFIVSLGSIENGSPKRRRFAESSSGAREEKTQAQTSRSVSKLLLHGRQVPGLLQHNNSVQSLADGGGLRELPDGAMPAYGWACEANGGLLIPEKGRLIASVRLGNLLLIVELLYCGISSSSSWSSLSLPKIHGLN